MKSNLGMCHTPIHAVVTRHHNGHAAYMVVMLVQESLNLIQRFLKPCFVLGDSEEGVGNADAETSVVVTERGRGRFQA